MLSDISKLKKIGKNVEIGNFVKIIHPEKIEIDDFARVDDFTIIVGGSGIKIGKFVHISSYCSVIGGGESNVPTAPSDTARPTGDVERADKGVAPGKHVRFDFRFVNAVGVGEVVDTDLG